jgi:hypothetical protein
MDKNRRFWTGIKSQEHAKKEKHGPSIGHFVVYYLKVYDWFPRLSSLYAFGGAGKSP